MKKHEGEASTAETETDDPVERLLQSLRGGKRPLGEQLALISAAIEKSEPRYAAAYDQLVERLKQANADQAAPAKGDKMPGFLLADENGRLVSLEKLLENGPVVVAFLRGHWCSYCRLNAIGLASIATAISPAQIVVISAETGEFLRTLREESGATFPFLSDIGSGYALSLGLQFWLGEDLAAMLYDDACDIPAYHGTDGWFLPIPGVFVVGTDGKISERYVNPDFRQRMELDALIAAAVRASAHDG